MESALQYINTIRIVISVFLKTLFGLLLEFKFEVVVLVIVFLVAFIFLFNINQGLRLVYGEMFRDKGKIDKFLRSIKKSLSKFVPFKKYSRSLYLVLFGTLKYQNVDEKYHLLHLGPLRIKVQRSLFLAIRMLLINLVIFAIVFFLVRKHFFIYPSYESVHPKENEVWSDFSKPVEIVFDTPVNKDDLIVNMSPETEGEWVFEKSFKILPFSRRLKFYPKETVMPGESVLVYLTNLSNYFNSYNGGEHLLSYDSIELPRIKNSLPANEAKKVAVDEDFVFNLDKNDGYFVKWEFEFDKDVDFEQVRDFSDKVKISFNRPLKQGKVYNLDVFQTPVTTDLENGNILKKGERNKVYSISFETVTPPLIASVYPEGTSTLPSEMVRIVFDQAMNRDSVEKAFNIEPEVQGDFKWEDDKTFTFVHQGMQKETQYEVKLMKGLRSVLGGITEQEVSFSFTTIGKVKVIGWVPSYNASDVSIATSVNVKFDQEVDKESAESKFSINPNVGGTFSWNGNTMIFDTAEDMDYSTSYTVYIAAGVKTVQGLDSVTAFSLVFSTEPQTIVLNVPQIYQTHRFTCNITAAAMLVSFKGIASGEMTVYNEIAKDNTSCTKVDDTIVEWGNPNSGYVGDIDGSSYCGGYGIYWNPVSSYLSSKGISNRIFSGWSVSDLAKEIEAGHPALIWGQNGWASPTDKSWSTPTGDYIYAINGMHSEVAVGFMGTPDNPTHIITNDPWRGRRIHTIEQFNVFWGYFGHTGIVVY